jgi:hypothetical protein
MKASALMFELRSIINKHGDLPIIGSDMGNDTPLSGVLVVDENSCDIRDRNTKPASIFLTS